MTVVDLPSDQAARERIRIDLDRTLFVEAGAGTGKTTALVRPGGGTGHKRPGHHTPGAGRHHLHRGGRGRAAGPGARAVGGEADRLDLDDEARGRVQAVLADVDEITITTLHGFASRLLGEFPLEAGLPPGFEVEDEIEASVRFDRRWGTFVDDLHPNPELRAVLARALVLRLPLRRLSEVARIFDDNWDRLGPARGDRPSARSMSPLVTDLWARPSVTATPAPTPTTCSASTSRTIAGPMHRELTLLTEVGDPEALLTALVRAEQAAAARTARQEPGTGPSRTSSPRSRPRSRSRRLGARPPQRGARRPGRPPAALRRRGRRGPPRAGGWSRTTTSWCGPGTCSGADAGVRMALAGRYRYLLIDEFQDTDPLQIEIAALLAAADPGRGPGRWHEIEVVPGKLFFVGDPKQSIYRFRRADIALYGQAEDAFEADLVQLTANFRSVPDVLVVGQPGLRRAHRRRR